MDDQAKHIDSLAKAIHKHNSLVSPYQRIQQDILAKQMAMASCSSFVMPALQSLQKWQGAMSGILSNSAFQQLNASLAAQRELTRSLSYHQNWIELISKRSKVWEDTLANYAKMTANIQSTIERFRSANVFRNSAISQMLQRIQDVGLVTRNTALALRLLEPPRIYTTFLDKTLSRIGRTKDVLAITALSRSLEVAQLQVIDASRSLDGFVALPTDSVKSSKSRQLVLPYVQQEELLLRKEAFEQDNVDITRISPACNIAQLSREVLNLVTACNEASKVSGKSEIFKPTTRALEVFADFAWILAGNKRSFGEFIDCVYFLLYEGAGKDNLRYLEKNGGVLKDDDCFLIWTKKHIRNKWLRHDPDHGEERAIRKSWRELSEKFQWLGLDRCPHKGEDFRGLQLRLLQETKSFLNILLSKMGN